VDQVGDQVTELNTTSGSFAWAHSNIWAGGKLVANYDINGGHGGIHFDIADPLGTKRVQVNAAGQVDETCTSLPFGNDINNPISVNCVLSSSTIDTLGTEDDATEHHYTGKERDAETGNDYFLARYYSSALGRFTTPDWSAKETPVPYALFDDPQSLNLYAYVRNNPITRIDSDGHCPPTDPNCSKMNPNPLNAVSPEMKQAIADAKKASDSPSSDDPQGGHHEEAVESYPGKDGKEIIAPAETGKAADLTKDKVVEIRPDKAADPTKQRPGDTQASVVAHIHPKGTLEVTPNSPLGLGGATGITYGGPPTQTFAFNQGPSPIDKSNAVAAPTLNIVVGAGNNRVSLFNTSGVVCSESFKEFMKP
jgi:RHS repeat-associated protein